MPPPPPPTGGTRTPRSAPRRSLPSPVAAPHRASHRAGSHRRRSARPPIPLTNGLTIGRGSTNTLALSEAGVSRQHAEIVQQEGAWLLRDLGSTNGTFVNERRVTTHRLYPGDSIKIGNTLILVR